MVAATTEAATATTIVLEKEMWNSLFHQIFVHSFVRVHLFPCCLFFTEQCNGGAIQSIQLTEWQQHRTIYGCTSE